MKKLTIVLLAFLFVGLGNVVAQTEATTETKTDEVKKECPWTKTADGKLICTKTGKICSEACVNKSKGKCCKGKRKGYSGCSKGKYSSNRNSSRSNAGFSFSKTGKSYSCSKKVIKKCGEDCTKACCAKTDESSDSDEDGNSEE